MLAIRNELTEIKQRKSDTARLARRKYRILCNRLSRNIVKITSKLPERPMASKSAWNTAMTLGNTILNFRVWNIKTRLQAIQSSLTERSEENIILWETVYFFSQKYNVGWNLLMWQEITYNQFLNNNKTNNLKTIWEHGKKLQWLPCK